MNSIIAFGFIASLWGTANAAIATIDSTCPLADANGFATFLIPANSSLGKINLMLIKFDTKRKLPFSSTVLMDQLNTQKALVRDDVKEPFGPIPKSCPVLPVPSVQFNCSGGISMTDAQKEKATPRYTWDRGHLTPANPMRFSEDALNKTFYCVNLAPQDSWTNQNPWKDIEVFTENKIKAIGAGYVMTGTCSSDNTLDGPTSYKKYTIPQCFWKLTCYKDKTTKEIKVVGYVGENTIVNFSDSAAQAARQAAVFKPKSQTDVLALLTTPELVTEGWKEAESNLVTGRSVSKSDLPTATECGAVKVISDATLAEWKL